MSYPPYDAGEDEAGTPRAREASPRPDAVIGYELVDRAFTGSERVRWRGRLSAWRARRPRPRPQPGAQSGVPPVVLRPGLVSMDVPPPTPSDAHGAPVDYDG